MMISPESYYDKYLKGKTVSELMTAMRSLKREVEHLKNVMEQQDYVSKPLIHPSEATRLWCTRQYLDRAKLALRDAGGIYELSKVEKKASDFDDNIPAITKVIFSIGGYFDGYETTTILLNDEHMRANIDNSLNLIPANVGIQTDARFTKEGLLNGFRDLHIGEWRPTYINNDILDGTQWELEFQYGNGHKSVKIYGSNAYPYNFSDFIQLLGIDAEQNDTDEDENDE